jgi:hypothetical protein
LLFQEQTHAQAAFQQERHQWGHDYAPLPGNKDGLDQTMKTSQQIIKTF